MHTDDELNDAIEMCGPFEPSHVNWQMPCWLFLCSPATWEGLHMGWPSTCSCHREYVNDEGLFCSLRSMQECS